MRRAIAIALLLLAPACSDSAPAPQQPEAGKSNAQAPSTAATVAGQASPATGSGSRLTGETSSLTGRISDFAVERTDFGTRVQLAADTLFEFDRAELAAAAETNLRRTADFIRQGGPGTVTIIGHTDSKGSEEYNLDLSRRRAEAVAAWLRKEPGMDGRQFAVQGRGEVEPVAPNAAPGGIDNPEGRARNRRVTVDIPR